MRRKRTFYCEADGPIYLMLEIHKSAIGTMPAVFSTSERARARDMTMVILGVILGGNFKGGIKTEMILRGDS